MNRLNKTLVYNLNFDYLPFQKLIFFVFFFLRASYYLGALRFFILNLTCLVSVYGLELLCKNVISGKKVSLYIDFYLLQPFTNIQTSFYTSFNFIISSVKLNRNTMSVIENSKHEKKTAYDALSNKKSIYDFLPYLSVLSL